MRYEVVPSLWRVGRALHRRGDVLNESDFNPSELDSARRLGLVRPVAAEPTRKELVAAAKAAGLKVPSGATKQVITELLEEAPDGL